MKRFTETMKWSDPWFRKLDPKFKAFWLYLVDSCDVAGIWDTDVELAEFQIGSSFVESEILEVLKERVEKLSNGKWYLTKFISFQYGELNPENNCHKAVIRSLEANGIDRPNKALVRASQGPKDKEKDQVRKKTEGEPEGKQFPASLDNPTFIAVWARWTLHRKQIKKPLTPEMERAAIERLSKLTMLRACKIVEYTIEKGWQGLADDDKVPGYQSSPFAPRPLPMKAEDVEPLFP